jgi:two-component system phosphate regulon sensor histidine kinase PhoR
MTTLNVILLLALTAALGWGWWLYRRLQIAEQREPPPIEQFTPVFHASAQALDVGLIVLDRHCTINYLNSKAEALLDTTNSLAIGQSFISIIRDYEADAQINQALRDNHPRDMLLKPLLTGKHLQLRIFPFNNEVMRGAVLSLRDITQITMLERARRDMVANVSHELRTPLASIKLLVETLQTEPPPELAQRMLSQMAQEVDAVTQLVDELHELSQIESGRVALKLAPTELEPLITHTIERIQPQAQRKGLTISAHLPPNLPPVLIDSQRVGQVLLNLLHNAVKFTTTGEISVQAQRITVGAEAQCIEPPALDIPHTLAPGDWMLVQVSDSGIGIPKEELPRIFERFYKVDRARTRNASGTGLGLAIAKHLIEGHGGCIWATSIEGAGSTFYVALPLA